MIKPENNFFLTGPSRSGTSLACSILNESPNCIALNEAFRIDQLGKSALKDSQYAYRSVLGFAQNARETLLETKSASSKGAYSINTSDPVADSYASVKRSFLTSLWGKLYRPKDVVNNNELRQIVHRIETIRFEKELSGDFNLILKHNLLFTAILNSLSVDYKCFAIVRNPLSTIASWNTINFALAEGDLPKWFKYWKPEVYRMIMGEEDTIDRQITLLEWMFGQYENTLPARHILTYEDIISSEGTSLLKALSLPQQSKVHLESRNQNPLYPQEIIEKVGERLLKRQGVIWSFYSKRDISFSS